VQAGDGKIAAPDDEADREAAAPDQAVREAAAPDRSDREAAAPDEPASAAVAPDQAARAAAAPPGMGRVVYLRLGLALLVVLAFLPILGNGFVNYDDPQYVLQNAHVRAGLTAAGLRWALTAQVAANWHPLTLVSHMLDVQLFGLNPKGHHLTSLLLHLANVLLLFEVLRQMTGAPLRSAVVAALFGVHPTRVEAVAWVADRKDLVCGLFWMLTLAAYLRYTRRPSPGNYLVVGAALAASLASKPMAMTLPFVLLLLDFWPLRRWLPAATARLAGPVAALPPTLGSGPAHPVRVVWEKIPLLGVCGVAGLIALGTQAAPVESGLDAPLSWRCANALTSYVAYVGKLLDPRRLAVFYPFQQVPAGRAAAAALLLAVVTALALLAVRRAPYLLVGWLWYVGTLVPVIGVLLVGWQSMADRYTYLPAIGLFVAAVWGLADLAHLAGRRLVRPPVGAAVLPGTPRPGILTSSWKRAVATVAAGACGALLIVLSAMTRRQAAYWSDSFTLFSHALTVQESYLAHTNVAEELRARGDVEGALGHYRAAVALAPRSPQARAALGNALRSWGRPAEAAAPLRAALALDPSDERAGILLAMALDDLGQSDAAAAALRQVLLHHPESSDARRGLAALLAPGGRGAAAPPIAERPKARHPG
jgi:hypothetical protein